jgi:hypothetical protein
MFIRCWLQSGAVAAEVLAPTQETPVVVEAVASLWELLTLCRDNYSQPLLLEMLEQVARQAMGPRVAHPHLVRYFPLWGVVVLLLLLVRRAGLELHQWRCAGRSRQVVVREELRQVLPVVLVGVVGLALLMVQEAQVVLRQVLPVEVVVDLEAQVVLRQALRQEAVAGCLLVGQPLLMVGVVEVAVIRLVVLGHRQLLAGLAVRLSVECLQWSLDVRHSRLERSRPKGCLI